MHSRVLTMVLAAALAAPLRAADAPPLLPAPGNLVAIAGCEGVDMSWDGVPGASAYAIELALVYEPGSDDCGAGPGATYVLRFALENTNVSIDAATLLFDFGSGLRAPCRVPLVRVRALSGAGEPEGPSRSAVPLTGCAPPPARPPSPRA